MKNSTALPERFFAENDITKYQFINGIYHVHQCVSIETLPRIPFLEWIVYGSLTVGAFSTMPNKSSLSGLPKVIHGDLYMFTCIPDLNMSHVRLYGKILIDSKLIINRLISLPRNCMEVTMLNDLSTNPVNFEKIYDFEKNGGVFLLNKKMNQEYSEYKIARVRQETINEIIR